MTEIPCYVCGAQVAVDLPIEQVTGRSLIQHGWTFVKSRECRWIAKPCCPTCSAKKRDCGQNPGMTCTLADYLDEKRAKTSS